jgi:steroid 5-alpha reductase family enzyme
MRRYAHLASAYVPAAVFIVALSARPQYSGFVVRNVLVQASTFALLAAVPAYRTGLMSYVDIVWPWGLAAIGAQAALFAPSRDPQAIAIATVYLAIGLRMGLPGLVYLVRHRRLPGEFPRYRYQRVRWEQAGFRGERLPMQLEIFLQGLANASVLAVPAVLLAFDRAGGLSVLETVALSLWAGCWSLEWLADRQKRRFSSAARLRGERRRTCDTGLWRYSRHPNYFFQWMGWNALALAALPALVRIAHVASAPESSVIALALLAGPAFMYWTLVHFTGIRPAEHYSVRKRPDYAAYQRSTNRFVPGRPRPRHARTRGFPTANHPAAARSSER